MTEEQMTAKVKKSREKAARRVGDLAKIAHEVRKAFDAMSPAEQQEGRAMLQRVANKAQLRRLYRVSS